MDTCTAKVVFTKRARIKCLVRTVPEILLNGFSSNGCIVDILIKKIASRLGY